MINSISYFEKLVSCQIKILRGLSHQRRDLSVLDCGRKYDLGLCLSKLLHLRDKCLQFLRVRISDLQKHCIIACDTATLNDIIAGARQRQKCFLFTGQNLYIDKCTDTVSQLFFVHTSMIAKNKALPLQLVDARGRRR